MRFTEEVELLNEEMQRVLRFLAWRQKSWLSKAEFWSQRPDGNTPHGEGLKAYAQRQAHIQINLASQFSAMWLPIPKLIAEACQQILDSQQTLNATKV
ncbi:hypothetical protein C0992_003231, partial [Termitomyces sp. T32_za158]